ncbi:Uncharacterized protein APZ42_032810 [Daphnia magna]|uniref:Uncharacterized protein n=1 Tax=Daphnia magna TaxID=35525 RepID=A0A164LVD6_9CRUS|nr:Uncharacterized protein APZ42_032810 [Daphnia magna]
MRFPLSLWHTTSLTLWTFESCFKKRTFSNRSKLLAVSHDIAPRRP